MTTNQPKPKVAKHTFTLNGHTYTRKSPRVYTHIVLGNDNPSWYDKAVRGDYALSGGPRNDCQLGWSQSLVNANKMAASMAARGWQNVRVYEVVREVK